MYQEYGGESHAMSDLKYNNIIVVTQSMDHMLLKLGDKAGTTKR